MRASPELVDRWMRRAQHDLSLVDALIEAGGYDRACQLAHRAAKRALKANYVARFEQEPPARDDLERLARIVDAPRALRDTAATLMLGVHSTADPDEGDAMGAEAYTAEGAARRREAARELISWAQEMTAGEP